MAKFFDEGSKELPTNRIGIALLSLLIKLCCWAPGDRWARPLLGLDGCMWVSTMSGVDVGRGLSCMYFESVKHDPPPSSLGSLKPKLYFAYNGVNTFSGDKIL